MKRTLPIASSSDAAGCSSATRGLLWGGRVGWHRCRSRTGMEGRLENRDTVVLQTDVLALDCQSARQQRLGEGKRHDGATPRDHGWLHHRSVSGLVRNVVWEIRPSACGAKWSFRRCPDRGRAAWRACSSSRAMRGHRRLMNGQSVSGSDAGTAREEGGEHH